MKNSKKLESLQSSVFTTNSVLGGSCLPISAIKSVEKPQVTKPSNNGIFTLDAFTNRP